MVNSSGSFKKKLYYTEPNVLDNIFHTDEVEEENYEDDDQEYTNAYSLHQNTVFELLEPGIFVGLCSPPNAIEPFFIAHILSKGLAEKNMIDEFGLSVLVGEMYEEVIYLQKLLERKKSVKYQKPKKTPNCFHSCLQNFCDKHLYVRRFNSKLRRVLLSFQSCSLS